MGVNYSIFLSTCDAFEDCWNPFFKLFKKYWPDYKGVIYMVTDWKDYQYDGLNIKTIRPNEIHHIDKGINLSWGKRMKWGLDEVPDDIILFMQEDFFIRGQVQNNIINDFAQLMFENPDIKCLHLTRPKIKDESVSEFEHLYNMKLKQKYRADCQPALWRKEEIYSLLKDEFTPWQFEVYGSKISASLGHRYLIVDKNWVRKNIFEIIPYVATGITKGKWNEDVIDVFRENDIQMDYEVRGFYDRGSLLKRVVRSLEWRMQLYKRECLSKFGLGNNQF